ncbi:MAG: carbohydrate ABC transporter permease [Clostridiales bacterium]|nr:carbohydrate ABC transporter permease [Clostridiales bacterium]
MVKKLLHIIGSLLILALAAVMIAPVILSLLYSVGINFSGVISPSLSGYWDFYIAKPLYLNAFVRSFLVSGAVTLGALIVSIPAAFVFAKVKMKGKAFLFTAYIIVMVMPFQVTLLPHYIVSKQLNIYDTLYALIIPGIFSCLPVFLLTQITKTLPNDIIEASTLETSNILRILWSIVIPNIKPGIICTAVLVFSDQWNLVAEPLVLIESESKFPLAVILNAFSSQTLYAFAAVVIFLLPPYLLFSLFKQDIMEGLGSYKLK